jgi:hypothetical protein
MRLTAPGRVNSGRKLMTNSAGMVRT